MSFRSTLLIAVAITLSLALAAPARPGTLKCPPDSVKVGTVCIDKYEASVWAINPANTKLVKKVLAGKVTLADLTAGGATQLAVAGSCTGSDYGITFPKTGNWTAVSASNPPSPGVYTVSIPGVLPSACITWFQANQACLLSGKRLLTNREWQGAAAGTPDLSCNNGSGPTPTGSNFRFTPIRQDCVSSWGVFDMVGNVGEWVADWADLNNEYCTDSTTAFGFAGTGDTICFGGNGSGSSNVPGAMLRGGSWGIVGAGVFFVNTSDDPSSEGPAYGFRCAR